MSAAQANQRPSAVFSFCLPSSIEPGVVTLIAIISATCLFISKQLIGRFLKGRVSAHDRYATKKCPNPDCIRCRRYAELDASARSRLPWILSAHDLTLRGNSDRGHSHSTISFGRHSLSRVSQAIRVGPNVPSEMRRDDGLSPCANQYPTILLIQGLTASSIITSQHHAACKHLEDGVLRNHMIQEYLLAQSITGRGWLSNDVSGETGSWKVLHLINQGVWVSSNVSLCPITAAAVRSLPGIMIGSIFGNAFISVLAPGTTVESHCGPSNARHRLHFPLVVPTATARSFPPQLKLPDRRTTWTEGKCFIFDDSLVHSVEYPNPSMAEDVHQPRVVLIADLWHPALSTIEREVIVDLYPSMPLK